jgi:ABC-2 type transport system ATP-binding protein
VGSLSGGSAPGDGAAEEAGTRSEPAVVARGVAFRYPAGRTGLAPLDLEIRPGEVVVVLGPNGSGKSTLLRLLATDLRPTSGELYVLGQPAVPPTPDLRRKIGYTSDEPVHLDPLTGEENLRFFGDLAGAGGSGGYPDPDERNARERQLLEAFALDAVAHVPVAQYSFGMRRKLLLAEALAPAPASFSWTNPRWGWTRTGSGPWGTGSATWRARGTAVVIATNEVRESPGWATRILFLDEGRVLVDGTPAELRARIPGGTRIRITLEGRAPDLPSVPGVTIESRASRVVEAVSGEGTRSLPALLQALVDAGAGIREIRVREPDLGDLFRELTGRELAGNPEPPGGAGAVPGAHDSAESRGPESERP